MVKSLTDVTGIGPSTAQVLMNAGINSAEELAQTSVARLSRIQGFSNSRAQTVIKAAVILLSESADSGNQTAAKKDKAKDRKGKGKNKKGKGKSGKGKPAKKDKKKDRKKDKKKGGKKDKKKHK